MLMCIGDIHGRKFWKDAVDKHIDKCDKVIFLGDYLDAYGDENITRKQEKENFNEILSFKEHNSDKVVLLLGNHCLHYIDKGFLRSTRYSSSNAYKYREMFLSHKTFFKIAHEETINDKKYLFTHAGVMKSWYERNKDIIGNLSTENLNRLPIFKGGIRVLSDVSKYRSWFGEESGSPLWSDVYEKIDEDKSKIDNVIPNDDSIIEQYDYQIFGHTKMHKNPIITDKWACLDCSKAFIINDEGGFVEC